MTLKMNLSVRTVIFILSLASTVYAEDYSFNLGTDNIDRVGEMAPDKKYVYINFAHGYNIRSSAKYDPKDRSNVAGIARQGQFYEIVQAKKFSRGYSLQIQMPDGSLNWIYKSTERSRSRELLFCREKDCSDLTKDILEKINRLNAKPCVDCEASVYFAAQETMPTPPTPPAPQNTHPETPHVLGNKFLGQSHNSNDWGPGPALHPSCDFFIKAGGEPGEGGHILADMINRDEFKHHYFGKNSMGVLCPNFRNLSIQQKNTAWIWYWAAFAEVESDCREDVTHPKKVYSKNLQKWITINKKVGYGYWAIEKFLADRRAAGRDMRYCGKEKFVTFEDQAICMVHVIGDTVIGKTGSAGSEEGNYSGPIMRGELLPIMQRYKPCFK